MTTINAAAEPLIFTGDCIEWLEGFADSSADHCFADPPYSDHVHAKSLRSSARTSKAKRRAKVEPSKRDIGFVALTPSLQRDVACELARVTRRWVGLFCNVELVSPWIFALQGAGLDYVRTMPWIKPNSAPQFTGDRPAAAWECIVLAHRKGRKRWNSGGKRGYHPQDSAELLMRVGYVSNIDHADRVHKTEKPLELMSDLILDFTDPGDLIIDPFAGGGTTGVACLRHGRRFAGAELDPVMATTAAERLIAEREDSTISARRAGQLTIAGALA